MNLDPTLILYLIPARIPILILVPPLPQVMGCQGGALKAHAEGVSSALHEVRLMIVVGVRVRVRVRVRARV